MIVGAALAVVRAINKPPKKKSPTKAQGLSPLKAVSIRCSCLDDLKKNEVLTEEEIRKEKESVLGTQHLVDISSSECIPFMQIA